uniref:Uncharacterized protein n=1 Tax=Ciona savignyi TaxID=51511 RepID=H2ZMA6_CIOSA
VNAGEAHDAKLYQNDELKPNNNSRKRILCSDNELIPATSSPKSVENQPTAAKRRCAEQDVAVSLFDISDGQIFPLDDSESSANNESIHSSFKACTGNVSSPKFEKQQFSDQIWSSSPILREKSPTAVKDTPGDHFLIRKWLNSRSNGPNTEKSTTTFYRQSPRRKLNYGVLGKIEQRFASISPTVNLERLKNIQDNEV